MRLQAVTIAILIGLISAAGACSTLPDEDRPRDHRDTVPLDVQQVARDTSAFQKEMLLDGVVNFAEYEKATLAMIDCLRKEGLTVNGPYPRNARDTRFLDFSFGAEGAQSEAIESINGRIAADSESCDREYHKDVARVWEFQHVLSPQERAAQRRQVIECLVQAGVSIREDSSSEDVYDLVARRVGDPAVIGCAEKYPDFFVAGVE